MRTSRRFQVRLAPALAEAIERYADAHGLALGPAMRLLMGRGLELEARWVDLPPTPDNSAALAALVAAEHAVLMVASILPEGEQRMQALAARATLSAEERLTVLREQPSASEEGAGR